MNRTVKRAVLALVLVAALMLVSVGGWAASSPTKVTALTVTGATQLNGGLTMDTNAFTVANTTGNTSIAGTLTVTGEVTGAGLKHYVSVPLAITANATAYTGVFVAHRAMTITKASVAFVAKPASTGGGVTLALSNYDLSATTSDNLLSTATIDLEGLTNLTASDLTLTSTAADKVLADGDFVYVTIISDNADMTGGTGGVLTIEYTLG